MRFFSRLGRRSFGAAIAALALLVYVTAPLVHGLLHADHEIVATLKEPSDGQAGQKPVPLSPQQDCALFKLYAGHGAHALTPPVAASLVQPVSVPQDVLLRIDPLPAGAPRGFALGRGPPHTA